MAVQPNPLMPSTTQVWTPQPCFLEVSSPARPPTVPGSCNARWRCDGAGDKWGRGTALELPPGPILVGALL